ncbi:MAG: cytochrome oxidase subunit III [Deltaproteobacteria bacterium]|nr:cytochrome oxidase subunit III [Deltaproteobacteria bacterium]
MSTAAKPIATLRSVTGVPTGRLAMWWLLASEIVIFGGLLMTYVMHRIGHPEWATEAAHTNTVAGAVNTVVLLSSSLSAVLAHQAAQTGNGKKAANYLWLTILGACMFLVIKSFEWTHEIKEGFVLTRSTFWSFYYCAAGLHALHVIAGSIAMAIVAIDAAKGKELQRVEYAGIYWHFVDVVWVFLFPLLYIAK